jgi:hypothetical protein
MRKVRITRRRFMDGGASDPWRYMNNKTLWEPNSPGRHPAMITLYVISIDERRVDSFFKTKNALRKIAQLRACR